MRAGLVGTLVLVLTACSISSPDPGRSPAARDARSAAVRVRAEWKAELARGVRERPAREFPNLSRHEFLRRLRATAEQYDFEIVEVKFLEPMQLAPQVVVESEDVETLARAYGRFWTSIDPKARTADDRTGWAWEGFLFEARDADGVPAFIVFHWWRARKSVGGGQWAREEALYPFAHL